MADHRWVAVLGSANLDLVVTQARLPGAGETIFGSAFSTVPGGKGLNQAVAAARAGARVRFLGYVGRDPYGDQLRTALVTEGIDDSSLHDVSEPTGIAQVSVVEGGENSIVVVPGANAFATHLDDPTRAAIAASGYLVAQLERPVSLVTEALSFARQAGVSTVLTPAPSAGVELAVFDDVDLLVPNVPEARELSGLDDEVAAACALSDVVGTVVMTRGQRGALVARGGEVAFERGSPTVTAVDTTGAGDTLVGVLVARLAAGAGLERALETALAAASLSVTRAGASASIPSAGELRELQALGPR